MAVSDRSESAPTAEVQPRLMFVPVSGPSGTGELQRCLIVAAAARRRTPDASIAFAVHQYVAGAIPAPYLLYALVDTPTRCTEAVIAALEEFRPRVAIFDGAGRIAQLQAARRLGCRTVFVSSRPSGRRKLFRWRRLRRLDEGWLAQPAFLEPAPSARERLKVFCAGRPTIRRLGPVFEPPVAARRETLLARLALEKDRYCVFCAGGGGDDPRRDRARAAFLRAAAMLTASTGLQCVVLTGTREASPTDSPGMIVLEKLPHENLMDLVSTARLALTNGGSLLSQTVALGTACIAVPVTKDQPARIAATVREELAIAGIADGDALVNTARTLLDSGSRYQRLKQRLAEVGVQNGLEPAVDALTGLLSRASCRVPDLTSRRIHP